MSALTEEDWPEEAFQATKRIEENMLNTKGDVAVYTEEEQMSGGIPRRFRERYPELETIELDANKNGKVGFIIVTTKIPAQGVIKANEKYVYKIMPPETPEQCGNSTKYFRLATSMRRALEEAKNMGRNELALIAPEELEEEKARKYIEIGARDIEIEVNFYSKKTKPNRKSWNKEDRGVVIVNSKDGKSYADLLKEVKEGVGKHPSQ
ncbi:hypothetical protein JTB14_030585 [Gonioctena quinquepunctata]|nr:hypothetical protein JTB14_030585 [Gonioctena quinquepunctata]